MARKSNDRQGRQAPHEDGAAVLPDAAERVSPTGSGRDAGRILRILALIAVGTGLAGLTAAACVLSYSGIHHLAIQAGVSGQLARLYPVIFDVMLVVAGCSVLALRGAGMVSRVYGWLCMLVLLGALAAGGAVHAAAVRIPHRLAGIVAAIVPWALVLIGFGLLLALLRYARIRRLGNRDDGHQAAELTGAGITGAGITGDGITGAGMTGAGIAGAGADGSEEDGARADGSEQEAIAAPHAAIPGMARTQQAIAPPGPPATNALAGDAAPDVAGQPGGAGRAPGARQAGGQGEPVPGSARPASPGAATGSSAGSEASEPPTIPGAAVPARPLSAAGAGDQGQRTAAPAPDKVQPRPVVRQADLQLRARIPRQPVHEQTEANPVPAPWPAPFTPRVGQQPGADQELPAGSPGSGQQPPGGLAAPEVPGPGSGQPGSGQPRGLAAQEVPGPGSGQQPGGAIHGAAGPTNPRPAADQPAGGGVEAANEPATGSLPGSPPGSGHGQAGQVQDPVTDAGSAPGPAGEPGPAAKLNPAPTPDADDELPAFRRPRSSPTPPDE